MVLHQARVGADVAVPLSFDLVEEIFYVACKLLDGLLEIIRCLTLYLKEQADMLIGENVDPVS